ncbi:DUF1360 domain-containing protein [Metabacillus sp. HB246100]|uniref:DUF1360 domain-containing protein n=1 Tax=Bacillus weihaiensis TaxID=1547283 RepID=UPI0023571705|nr:DUF1360 domain-containing protein [Bacillus weihaiensis]
MLSWLELMLIGLASFRLTRLIVFDKITTFLRAPFHKEVEEVNEAGEVEIFIEIKGTGVRSWIGELLSCYWCTGVWCAAFLYGMDQVFPFIGEPFVMILAIAGFAGIIEAVVGKLIE